MATCPSAPSALQTCMSTGTFSWSSGSGGRIAVRGGGGGDGGGPGRGITVIGWLWRSDRMSEFPVSATAILKNDCKVNNNMSMKVLILFFYTVCFFHTFV